MVVVLGGRGFVGSAFTRLLAQRGIAHKVVGRDDYAAAAGAECDVLVNAAGRSVKYLADSDPADDFDRSVRVVVNASRDFRPRLHVLLSSVDVYADLERPATTSEETPLDPVRASMYGFHKQLAEFCGRRHNAAWLIVRLAGMVGPGLRKNPVFDILNDEPVRIAADSRYQFMATDDVADVVWDLVERSLENTVFNVCGSGLISPREIAAIAGRTLAVHPEAQNAAPRIVDVAIDRITRIRAMPATRATIERFVRSQA
jgi:nucleoside-diphosphate-sugar epimerase